MVSFQKINPLIIEGSVMAGAIALSSSSDDPIASAIGNLAYSAAATNMFLRGLEACRLNPTQKGALQMAATLGGAALGQYSSLNTLAVTAFIAAMGKLISNNKIHLDAVRTVELFKDSDTGPRKYETDKNGFAVYSAEDLAFFKSMDAAKTAQEFLDSLSPSTEEPTRPDTKPASTEPASPPPVVRVAASRDLITPVKRPRSHADEPISAKRPRRNADEEILAYKPTLKTPGRLRSGNG